MIRRSLLLALLTLCCTDASPLAAQAAELARIDTLIARTRLADARSALADWQATSGRKAGDDDAAYALLLRARLTPNADSALALYSEVALGHPTTRSAPEALLRLGQGYFAQRAYERAAGHLGQLTRDYPASPQRSLGYLWLGRTQLARARKTEGCAALQQGLALRGIDEDVSAMLRAEQAACASPASKKTETPAPRSEAKPAASTGSYTIQVAAYRDAAAARALADRLAKKDIAARVVLVGDGSLAQVRAGRFRTRADASTLLQRVRAIVPGAIITDDAAREHPLTR